MKQRDNLYDFEPRTEQDRVFKRHIKWAIRRGRFYQRPFTEDDQQTVALLLMECIRDFDASKAGFETYVNKRIQRHFADARATQKTETVSYDDNNETYAGVEDDGLLAVLNDDQTRSACLRLLQQLPARDAAVVKLRVGLSHQKPHTIDEISRITHLHPTQVRRILDSALHTLREKSAA